MLSWVSNKSVFSLVNSAINMALRTFAAERALSSKLVARRSCDPVWARERCRISPPRFLAECCKRQLNRDGFVLLYFRMFTFSDLY